jgi:hypothetical protein
MLSPIIKKKKGQVTVFLIIGIIILLSFLTMFFFKSSFVEDKIDQENENIYGNALNEDYFLNYVNNCLEKTGTEALIYVANNGGYYHLPELSNFGLPYFFYNETDFSPDFETVETELGNYVNDLLFFCLEKFEPFSKQGFLISSGEISTSVDIIDDQVIYSLNHPIIISKSSKELEMSQFQIKIKSNLKRFLDFKDEFMIEQINDTKSICISCLRQLSEKYSIEVDAERITNESFVFTFTDNEMLVPNTFNFINYYHFENVTENEN